MAMVDILRESVAKLLVVAMKETTEYERVDAVVCALWLHTKEETVFEVLKSHGVKTSIID